MTKNGILPSVERTVHTCSSLMRLMQSHQQQCPPLPHHHRYFHSSSYRRFHESHIQCKRGGFISRTGEPPQPQQHGKPVPDQSVAEVEASPPKDEGLYDVEILIYGGSRIPRGARGGGFRRGSERDREMRWGGGGGVHRGREGSVDWGRGQR